MEANGASQPDGLLLVKDPIDMLNRVDVQKVCDLVTKYRLGLVQIDTLSRAIPGGDENSGSDMGAFIANCSKIQACGAAVNVIHHPGHSDTKRERGWSGFSAAADIRVRVSATAEKTVRIHSEKLKDGDPPQDVYLQVAAAAGSVVLKQAKPSELMQKIVEHLFLSDRRTRRGRTYRTADHREGGEQMTGNGISIEEVGRRVCTNPTVPTSNIEGLIGSRSPRHGLPAHEDPRAG